MSNVNIMRAVDNIRSGTNVYTPVVETIVNAIQAIESTTTHPGRVIVEILRSPQGAIGGEPLEITGFRVTDTGVGFTEDNRKAFDTLYTTNKLAEGGKGFGRFTFLKYFDDVLVESTYHTGSNIEHRSFRMGKETELIINERISEADATETGSTVTLSGVKRPFPDKTIPTIARTLVERLLPYFIDEGHVCPRITLQETNGSEATVLNEYLGGVDDPLIVEALEAQGTFTLPSVEGPQAFNARVFKLYSPRTKRSRISLVAHRREVTATSLHQYIPEFVDEFFEDSGRPGELSQRNFVVAVYVLGSYLDDNVSVERGGFEFQKDADLLLGISQRDIEAAAAKFGRKAVTSEVRHRQERKVAQVHDFVRYKAPWHAVVVEDADLTSLPCHATEDEIDVALHRLKYAKEVRTKQEVRRILSEETTVDELEARTAAVVREISESSRSELVHYVALRRSVLDILARSLEKDEEGKYRSEGTVHDIIFPRKGDTDKTAFDDHNLWILDERLNFTEYVSSDIPLTKASSDRPDLIAFGRRIGFRGKNEPSNPVVIFELKRPGRDDFADASSKENPVDQIIRYVGQIRDGHYRTPAGREIQVGQNTPFYGYVVCDLTPKVRKWARESQDFKPLPDGLGFFRWHSSLNLYLEILGWDKVHKDASERNRVFFHKLGIE